MSFPELTQYSGVDVLGTAAVSLGFGFVSGFRDGSLFSSKIFYLLSKSSKLRWVRMD